MQPDDRWDDEEPDIELASYEPHVPIDDAHDLSCASELYGDVDEHAHDNPDVSFTVSNPSGALAATTTLGGRLRYIEVRDVSQLDESRLGEGIVELAALATEKARAAQHEVTADLLRGLGQDRAAVSALLEHSVGLPTYEAASARAAEAFAAYNRSNDD